MWNQLIVEHCMQSLALRPRALLPHSLIESASDRALYQRLIRVADEESRALQEQFNRRRRSSPNCL